MGKQHLITFSGLFNKSQIFSNCCQKNLMTLFGLLAIFPGTCTAPFQQQTVLEAGFGLEPLIP